MINIMINRFLIIIILIFTSLIVFSQNDEYINNYKHKNKIAPPGTVWIKENLYMDKRELCNIDYLEYIYWLQMNKGLESDAYKNALPDTLVWRRKLAYNEPYVQYYFRHPAYHNHPAVGLKPKQIKEYCKWRTERVKEKILVGKGLIAFDDILNPEKKSKIEELKKGIKLKYRLPTENEWMYAASAGGYHPVFPWESDSFYDKKGKLKANVLIRIDNKPTVYENPITTASYTYEPNFFGIYDCAGNVAEFVVDNKDPDKYWTKGGSWFQLGFHATINSKTEYKHPTNYIGFRCICEYKE